jgi:hypothetical protein
MRAILVALCLCQLGCGWGSLANDQAIGRACDLSFTPSSDQGAYNASASECPSNICLKPVLDLSRAELTPSTGPTCTAECSQDSDCEGELRDSANPEDRRCKSGFTCAVPFEVGPLCCRKLCVCKDFLAPVRPDVPSGCLDFQKGGSCPGLSGNSSSTPVTGVGEETEVITTIAPVREVDIVTMVDNSPTMGPKIEKFKAAFPKLIEALRDPADGSLPDLRVAIIDSDLGTGGQYPSGPCGPKLLADGTSSLYGDLGGFQMRSSPSACPFTPGSLFLEHRAGAPLNYAGDLGSVFSCLAGNLGTAGCGETHQLQAFEFALIAQNLQSAIQKSFLRQEASLGLIFLSDKDDCSAATNDAMFGDKPELRGESISLRCATRGHACGGLHLSDSGPGYPTTQAFTDAFTSCAARTDACSNVTDGNQGTDTSRPTTCSPLKSMRKLADEIKALKGDSAQEKILVAGLFGWPLSDADMAAAQYKIAPVPNPDTVDTAHPTVFDSWPVCYDPNHQPSPATTDPATGFDATAAAWGATGGLRESAFLDEFGTNGMKLSACQPDYSTAMASIGRALLAKLTNACFPDQLVDTDPATPGIQADCWAVYRFPNLSGPSVVYVESTASMPQCQAGATNGAVAMDCWQLTADPVLCPGNGQRVSVLRTQDEVKDGPLPAGTKLRLQCRTCPAMTPASSVPAGCEYLAVTP